MPTADVKHTQGKAQTLAATLPALLLAAEQIAASVSAGVHGRRRAGPGEQFWQYRRYQPGDPAQLIDWRASGRSTHILVREREWEAAQTALLWLDRSPSFDWSSSKRVPLKSVRGELMLLALADLLLRGGERVGLIGTGTPPMSGRGILGRIATQMLQLPAGAAVPPLKAYPRHARIVLFGDFLDPVDELAARLRPLFAHGLRGHLVQVLDPAEVVLPWQGRIIFEGLEGEGHYIAPRADKLRDAYREKFAAHEAALQAMLKNIGWTLQRHRTDHRPELALMQLYQALSEPC